MSDLNEILTGEKPEPEAVEAQPEAPEQAEAEEPAKVEEPPAEAPQEEPKAEEDPKDIPYAVFKSTREDLKGQLEEARAELARIRQEQQQPKREPEKAPDMYEDPEGFTSYMSRQMQQMRLSTIADVSETMAMEVFGEETVQKAFDAVKAAGVGQQFVNSRHPYGEMVKWYRQQQVVREIGDDPVAYRESLEKEIRQKIEAEIAAKQAQEMASKAPPSMANVNGSGGQRDPGWQGPTPLDKLIGP